MACCDIGVLNNVKDGKRGNGVDCEVNRESSNYKWFVLGILTLVYTFNFIDRQILVILQEPIKADLGLSDTQLGLLTGFSFAVVYVTAGIPIAWLADRSNRRNIVAASLGIFSVMTALSGLVQNYTQLLLARLGVGLGEAGGSPPSHSMLSDYFPEEKRGTALSIYTTGIYFGIFFGYFAGGWIAESFGWRKAFFIVGIPGIALALLLLLLVREPPRTQTIAPTVSSKPRFKETISVLLRRPAFWWIALGCSTASFVGYGNGNFFPSLLIRNYGLSVTEAGVVLGVIGGTTGMLGTFLGGYLADRWGKHDKRWYVRIPLYGLALSFPLSYLTLLGSEPLYVIMAYAPGHILNTLYLGPCIAICHTLVSPAMRASASAVLLFVINMIGLGLGPLFVGALSDAYSAHFGDENLRYAMITSLTLGTSGLFFFWKAQKALLGDIEKAKSLSQDG